MKKNLKGQKGQLSIFLGIIMVIIITLMAFIINVGLFVKAKINLQNAVDAAAWSGAAVQARQLTNIAYLNWEMRNTYKEWMFKYYVIGQLGLSEQLDPAVVTANSETNFKLIPFPGSSEFDPFNLPSTCMSFGGSKDICKLYNTPGLPRFEAPGMPGIDDQHQSFENVITKIKASNCSKKSVRNFASAMIWAYGIKKDFFNDTPSAASHRTGAWIQAIELGLRMRNLEALVNRPPLDDPICFNSNSCTRIGLLTSDIVGQFGNPYNERPIKAFKSAFRNLSGGAYKSGVIRDEFASSFKLTELKPKVFNALPGTLSHTLIPQGASINIGSIGQHSPSQKSYLDLIAYPLNLVSFYTTLVVNNSGEAIKSIVGNTPVEGNCGATKTGLPVPGYMFGYVKNPKVLTYYAVKGEADFIGLFYPFTEDKGITLQAYASAKPFGGRVGPMLFGFGDQSVTHIVPRADSTAGQRRTLPYLSGLRVPGGSFAAGQPIPTDQAFWLSGLSSPIGGAPTSGTPITFGIPNILYDYVSEADLSQHATDPTGKLLIIEQNANALVSGREKVGLYDSRQYARFASHLDVSDPTLVTATEIEKSLESVRQATRYEALNYMIPTMEEGSQNPENLAAFPSAVKKGNNPITGNPFYELYAPLFGPDTLYTTPAVIIGVIQEYLGQSSDAIELYLDSLKTVATDIAGTATIGGASTYKDAAESIYPLVAGLTNMANCDKLSMATRFNQFFNGTSTACDINPLPDMIQSYISEQSDLSANYQNFYSSSYVKPTLDPILKNKDMLSAYVPGPRQGSNEDGELLHPYNVYPTILSAKRNYYSTKFVAMKSVAESGQGTYQEKPIYSESSNLGEIAPDLNGKPIVNSLQSGQLNDFGDLTH
ncbi:hypothetical protein A9Q84_07645 [Halobacteriovorax marinus]|uniref:Putative Flp pilus-assembly TadG-like N-terminal domain-containing protein n=1 Tax=Halobacteriovorax marinus TaxID=97084 RepID=A0A1Y5FC69_9BACT|nr:hypothetical protein A9Q84_07645 [Halobacteriovorax marinus]